ncbi:MAG: DUF192 domain-containing protein [Dethiobacter sp.]|nr:DUF192 domain-containing protein [Dethiobacter sp.]
MLYNVTKKSFLARKPLKATGFGGRLRGLMFRSSFPAGCDALFLYPCRAIHTYFLRFPIDILLLDDSMQIISAFRALEPGKIGPLVAGVTGVMELPAGVIDSSGTSDGDQLTFIQG